MVGEDVVAPFERDGFVVVRGVFTRDEIDRVIVEVEAYVRDVVPAAPRGDVYYEDSPVRPIKSLFRMHLHAPFFARLMADPRLLALADAVFPPGGETIREGVMFFGKPARDGSVTPAHQDNAFQCWDPPHALTATLALDASTPDNGALTCLRGTHRLGLLPHRQSGVAGFSRCLIHPVDEAAHPPVELCVSPGDVAMHHIQAVHRSGANTTDRPRRQLAFAYRSSLAQRDMAKFEEYQARLRELVGK